LITSMMSRLLRHLKAGPFTNPFPLEHLPPSLAEALKAASEGRARLNPPVPVPEGFRGVILYEKAKCIGCRMCIRVCPANAISFIPEEKKVLIHTDRCTFCAQCNDVCPVNCLHMSREFALSTYDRKREAYVRDSGLLETTSSGEEVAQGE